MKILNTRRRVSLRLIIAFCFGYLGIIVNPAHAAVYYLSPQGNDNSPGTITQPWQTLNHAFTRLAPGDTLYLRDGSYYYPSAGADALVTSLQGIEVAPIVISSYPRERARINGGVPDFETAPNSEWQLVDARIQLYKSKSTVSFHPAFLGGWLLDYSIQLLNYEDYETLISTDYEAPDYYAGPGVHGSADGHVYIRLQQNPLDMIDFDGKPIPPLLSDLDPNHHRINIFSGTGLIVLRGASYVKLRNLDIGPSIHSVIIEGSSHHIEIDHCDILYRGAAVISDDGKATDLLIHHNQVTAGFPAWNYWGDVKEGSAPAGSWDNVAFTGIWKNVHIHHNVIRNGFDGISILEGSANTLVTDNIIIRSRDDPILLRPTVVNIEVARNLIRHSYEGISIANEDNLAAPIGDVYIHHNIIDLTFLHRIDRTGNIGGNKEEELFAYDTLGNSWSTGIAFGAHGCSEVYCISAHWKVYSNTIVGWQTGTFTKMLQRAIQNAEVYFYNNVFYNIGGGPILLGSSEHYKPSTGMHWDGNIYWRTADEGILFAGFGGGLYFSLKEFLSDPNTAPWERTNALQIDPGFNIDAIRAENYNLETMWELYRPSNLQVFTLGVSYDGLNWPGTETVNYRGAIAPKLPTHINPNAIGVDDEFHLYQNIPNPFNSSTTISYRLSQSSHVILTIYNTAGQEVYKLVDEFQTADTYTVTWNGINNTKARVSSGIYFYKIKVLNYSMFKKMLFLK